MGLAVRPLTAIYWDLMWRVKGQTSTKLLKQFRELRKKPYWGNHFWVNGYCVDTAGPNADMIRAYVEKRVRLEEQAVQPANKKNSKRGATPWPVTIGAGHIPPTGG